jgi:hypothetical protein
MKTSVLATLLSLIVSLSVPTLVWAGGSGGSVGGGDRGGSGSGCSAPSSETLTQNEIDTLLFMREEEKVARDLYIRFDEMYGDRMRIFARIASSEQKHMDAVKNLLDAYGLPDPVGDNSVGDFTSGELAYMFDTLLARGSVDFTAALEVGVTIEEQDMTDLADAILESDEVCIDKVYAKLLEGSTRHLAAFTRRLQ